MRYNWAELEIMEEVCQAGMHLLGLSHNQQTDVRERQDPARGGYSSFLPDALLTPDICRCCDSQNLLRIETYYLTIPNPK